MNSIRLKKPAEGRSIPKEADTGEIEVISRLGKGSQNLDDSDLLKDHKVSRKDGEGRGKYMLCLFMRTCERNVADTR